MNEKQYREFEHNLHVIIMYVMTEYYMPFGFAAVGLLVRCWQN